MAPAGQEDRFVITQSRPCWGCDIICEDDRVSQLFLWVKVFLIKKKHSAKAQGLSITGIFQRGHCDWNNHSKARVAELMSDKVDFKAKNVTKVKGGHFIMISGQLMHRI